MNHFNQFNGSPSDFVACNFGTDFWKQEDIEVGVCGPIPTVGSVKDGCEVLIGGVKEEVWAAWWETWNEGNAPSIFAEVVLKPSKATPDKALLMVLVLDTSADVSCCDKFAGGNIVFESPIKLLGAALLGKASL